MPKKIYNWFIKNLISRTRVIDISGYVLAKMFDSNEFARLICLGETLISNLETQLLNENDNHATKLYKIGKNFGYSYSSMLNIKTRTQLSTKAFKIYSNFLIKTVEAVYANKISYKIDFKKCIFQSKMDNYIICRKNGFGYIFTTGGIAGI